MLSMGGGHTDRVQGERTEGDCKQVEIQRKCSCLVCLSDFFNRNSFYLCYISSLYNFSKTFFLKKSQTIGQRTLTFILYPHTFTVSVAVRFISTGGVTVRDTNGISNK